MGLQWRPLADSFGAELVDFDLELPIAGEVGEALRALWLERGLLLFRGRPMSGEQQVALSRLFGELEVHPAREGWVEGHPELTVIQYHPENRDFSPIYEVEGEALANWLPWHIDLIYTARINRAGCLRALTLPPKGAPTGFIDRAALYDSLPAALKAEIQGKRAVYRLNPFADEHPFYPYGNVRRLHVPERHKGLKARVGTDFPDASHPIAFAHPDTGRMILNLSPTFLIGIEGMADAESEPLLRTLVDHVLASPDRYYHRWQPDDVILWDNWRMLHSAEGTPVAHSRQLYRTTVSGDYGLGRLAQ